MFTWKNLITSLTLMTITSSTITATLIMLDSVTQANYDNFVDLSTS